MKHITVLLIICFALFGLGRTVTAESCGPLDNPYFVDWENGSDTDPNYDGKSWAHAKKTIQAAINATRYDGPAQVWVRGDDTGEHKYEECISTGRTYSSVYGGFAGNETSRLDRKWWTYPTIIDGGGTTGNVVTLDCTTVDGFIIQHGAVGVGVTGGDGGWVSHNTISNVGTCVRNDGYYAVVKDNLLTDFAAYGVQGGGMDLHGNTILGSGGSSCGLQYVGDCTNNIIAGCHYAIENYPGSGVTNNDFWDNYADSPTPYENIGGNLHDDPLFVDADAGDYRLWGPSHCIDAGALADTPWEGFPVLPGELDLSGQERVLGDDIDIGAYRYATSEHVTVGTVGYDCGDTDVTWNFYLYQTSHGLEITASTTAPNASIDHVDAWIDGIRVEPAPIYDEGSGHWLCTVTWPPPTIPSQLDVFAGATDTEGNYADCAITVTLDLDESDSIVFVKPDDDSGSSTHDGHSWLTARHSVQDAITDAYQMTPTKGEVWVAAGDYDPITLADGVAVYGGFLPGMCSRGERDWAANVTTLRRTGWYNAHVVTASGVGSGTVLDGFTVTAGSENLGGGIFCYNSSPTIANNTFSDNEAGSSGGGIYITGGLPTITRNRLTGNHASSTGGAIYCESSSAHISDNVILDNRTYSHGGGIYVASGSPAITNNTLSGNTLDDTTTPGTGGGMYVNGGTPVIANNIVVANSDGIWWAQGLSPSITYNDVWSNPGGDYKTEPDSAYHNISVDPEFLADGYHIPRNSPCTGKGYNSVLLTGETDIDGGDRIYPANGNVDIGADETDNCGWHLTLTAPEQGPMDDTTVTATLTDDSGSLVTETVTVHFEISGAGEIDPEDVQTSSGVATTYIVDGPAGRATITASVDDECEVALTATAVTWLFDPTPDDWPMFMHDAQHTGMSRTWDGAVDGPSDPLPLGTPEWVADLPTASTDRQAVWPLGQYEPVWHPNPAACTGYSTWIFQHPYIDSSPVVVQSTRGCRDLDTRHQLPHTGGATLWKPRHGQRTGV